MFDHAVDEIAERERIAGIVVASRAEQGLPAKVEDPAVLAPVARLLTAPRAKAGES